MTETPIERFRRRSTEANEELAPLLYAYSAKMRDIREDLEAAQKICQHVDNGGMFHGICVLCGEFLG